MRSALACLFLGLVACFAAEAPLKFNDPKPQIYQLRARASEIDKRCLPHPEIDFVFEKGGKPADVEVATVDTRVTPRGQLVIWLMGFNQAQAELLNSYGLHYIQVSYANGWFGKLNTEPADDTHHLGDIRLEATAGVDASKSIEIPLPDSMQERAFQFVKHLAKKNPQGKWETFLTKDGKSLEWEKVIVSGASHGATSSARFALHQKVGRVVMHCGPRDNLDDWQAGPSATPKNRFFGYSHVLDGGWTADHYQRSWLLLGLNQFGPIVNTESAKAPFGHSRRLITDAALKGNEKEQAARGHGYVKPSKGSPKDENGKFIQDDVWRYLYTSDVEKVGAAVPAEAGVKMDQRSEAKPKAKKK
jgi:hypothetical protein